MMRTGRIPQRRAVEGAVKEMAMRMTTVRVKRTCRAERKEAGKVRVQMMGWGTGWGRQRRKGRGTSAKCILGIGSVQEYLRGCGV